MNYLNIALQASDEKTYKLSDFKGQKLIVYFYPKDNTSGCTLEAKDFTDLRHEFEELGYKIIGVSKDSIKSHKNFISKQALNLLLLSDPDTQLIQAFDVWKEKQMYGKSYMGVERSTFILDEEGQIIKEYRNIKAKDHAQNVLDDLKG
ncbi:peroxiredoxin [Hujiaoplasma nucleasis]|uniref:thioredoxin-dependent peroxiredoxin n=1 Tax=Hujiaoplasma nucleasis TaxID=2725268 RepID=A0A7L6N569_9MOLU|nr:peroxiredoxin [Hujiaoplasma nucleasis]QLY40632.1 peroxiredoxin [Hujiaoplasma nucleasis]